MLAALPNPAMQRQQNTDVSPVHVDDDRLCAGCNRSVSSETGGVVVEFGNSLWHVDCFKCAKCENQLNADTNLLLLSDGSPVCANCYNCKVCNLPILDEAVMTGNDSYHAACFTCQNCKNRIDELVFAKTSQGFYCMKCHNERVARSRRHMARREKEKQAIGSSSGRSAGSRRSGRSREGEKLVNAPELSLSSSASRPGYASGTSSSDSHARSAFSSSQTGSRTSASSSRRGDSSGATDQITNVVDASFVSTNSISDSNATIVPRAMSPAPPALSITMAISGSSDANDGKEGRSKNFLWANLTSNEYPENNNLSNRRPSLDGPTLLPYSTSPPSEREVSGVDSTRSSGSYRPDSTSSATSPSLSVSHSQESSVGHSRVSLDYTLDNSINSRSRADSPTFRDTGGSSGSVWPNGMEPTIRRKSYDDGTRPLSTFLSPTPSVAKNKRDKRGSINPGLQLEASKFLNLHSEVSLTPSSSLPSSPVAAAPKPYRQSLSPPAQVDNAESPATRSPLGATSVGNDGDSSGSTSFYSPAPSLAATESPPALRNESVTSQPSTASSATVSFAPGPRDFLARIPQRSDSLRGLDSVAALESTTPTAIRVADPPATPNSAASFSRRNVPGSALKNQRSFDGRLSPRKFEFSNEGGRSRSISPKPPDVPKGIESGTDTDDLDNDSDDITQSYMDRSYTDAHHEMETVNDEPPAPPPKDGRSDDSYEKVQQQADSSAEGTIDSDLISESDHHDDRVSPTSAIAERTSGFFIAPALPPMRFSTSGTDFKDILSTLASSGSRTVLPNEKRDSQSDRNAMTIMEDKEEETVPAKTPSIASTITPQLEGSTEIRKSLERPSSLQNRKNSIPELFFSGSGSVDHADQRSIPTSPTSQKQQETSKKRPHRTSRSETAIKLLDERTSSRTSSEGHQMASSKLTLNGITNREKSESDDQQQDNDTVSVEVHSPGLPVVAVSRTPASRSDSSELVVRRLREALADATERAAEYIKLDKNFVEAILSSLDYKKDQVKEFSSKLDNMKRTSQLMFDGLSVVQNEYGQELTARRNAEAEVLRLKIEVSGQAAKLTALTSDERRREVQKQLTQELSDSLNGLERDLSKLKVERDMTLAEVEELSVSKSTTSTGEVPAAGVSRSLTMRLDNIKRQYQHDLVPLKQQREALVREILELKEARDIFLEETAVLNVRNEELAQLNSSYERKLEAASNSDHSKEKTLPTIQPSNQPKASFDTWRSRQAPAIVSTTSGSTTTSGSATLIDESEARAQPKPGRSTDANENRYETPVTQRTRAFGVRWPGNKANKEQPQAHSANVDSNKGRGRLEHSFQQFSMLRFGRCDHCGDKMWGSQVRCSACNLSVHVRCVHQVQTSCVQQDANAEARDDSIVQIGPPPPSMFGRDLIEQAKADSKDSERFVPVIVDKCIDAVETLGMDYEGIYRKTGGSGQSKAITLLFERGNYDSFDLCDSDSFNDISSVTSVLKNYFRALPNPLLTYALHESFIGAAGVRDQQVKAQALKDLVVQLPAEHYHTLSRLMLHLYRVQSRAEENLMTARNLSVIFGPTLMRSQDPGREFADMAGKSFAIEFLIEHATSIFTSPST